MAFSFKSIALTLALLTCVGCSDRPSSSSSSTLQTSQPSTFLWRIDADPPSFLFGTIHVPYTRVWDSVSPVAKRAFRFSRHLYLELDLTDADTLRALSRCQLLPGGAHLSQVVPSELFLRLKMYLDNVRADMTGWLTPDQLERGLTADYLFHAATANWERKRPAWVMMMLGSLTPSDVASRGVPVLDLRLRHLAAGAGKRVGAIETPDEQCEPINALSEDRVVFALNHTLSYYEARRLGIGNRDKEEEWWFDTDSLIDRYRRGDLESMRINQDIFQLPAFESNRQLTEHEREMSRDLDAYFQTHMVEARNRRMAARVVNLLVNRPGRPYFFAFGAGHFVGPSNVVKLLDSAGFAVEPVSSLEDLQLRGKRPGNLRNRVPGTFADLPDEEKTRALLQFLQYKQHMEEANSTRRFEQMVGGIEVESQRKKSLELEDEREVEESIKAWYGLEGGIGQQMSGGTTRKSVSMLLLATTTAVTALSKIA